MGDMVVAVVVDARVEVVEED